MLFFSFKQKRQLCEKFEDFSSLEPEMLLYTTACANVESVVKVNDEVIIMLSVNVLFLNNK
jgi:hypothetical protein